MTETRYATTWWTSLDDGRIRCDVCPRACALHDGLVISNHTPVSCLRYPSVSSTGSSRAAQML